MKRNRESKYRIRLVSYLEMNKERQTQLDEMVQEYGLTYREIYDAYTTNNYSKLLNQMVEKNLLATLPSLGLFNGFHEETKKSFYRICGVPSKCLGIDLSNGKDMTSDWRLMG